ncbi:MAG: alpha/beta fold hydrolase, partial [Rhizobacter sp.]|nr:alpha/beta fold hydrolase [Chlorobiales bacterium]
MKKILVFLVVLFTSVNFTASTLEAKTYVLVHGAFLDGTAWDKVKPLLEAQGHKVIVVNLPAHGNDPAPVGSTTFADYTKAVGAAINGQKEKVILVGHSLGGMVVSAVAEMMPEKIEKLVYLAAFLPQSGENATGLNKMDADSKFGEGFVVAPDGKTATFKKEMVIPVFAADASEADKKMLLAKGKPEPVQPFNEKVTLTAAKFGGVPKVAIQTALDKAVSAKLQKEMDAKYKDIKKV